MSADPYAGARATGNYGGVILRDDKEIASTVQCCHCGNHWMYVKGSGKVRGFCFRCNAMTCGPECLVALAGFDCLPHEEWLRMMETGVRPTGVTVSTSGLVIPTNDVK